MEKKKCKGCKNKPLTDLNKEKIEEEGFSPLVKTLIFVYTVLAVYGSISLVIDIKELFKTLF
tara:strand:- start:78 stop:263 length:186 start_codon:yes stop_codon:yes gene_type:complete